MKKILLGLLVLGLLGAGYGYYMFNKPVASTEGAKASFAVEAPALFSAFEQDEAVANEKYLNQVVEVSGTLGEIKTGDAGNPQLVLKAGDDAMFGVICEMESGFDVSGLQTGRAVKVKGVVSGMLMDVVLVRCVLVE